MFLIKVYIIQISLERGEGLNRSLSQNDHLGPVGAESPDPSPVAQALPPSRADNEWMNQVRKSPEIAENGSPMKENSISQLGSRQAVMRSIMRTTSDISTDSSPAAVNDKELWEACRTGDISRVRDLLSGHGSSINARDINGRRSTPLHFAAGFGRREVVEYLLEIGGDVSASDEGGENFVIFFL